MFEPIPFGRTYPIHIKVRVSTIVVDDEAAEISGSQIDGVHNAMTGQPRAEGPRRLCRRRGARASSYHGISYGTQLGAI
jgi:hypothetical protein